MSQLNPGQGGYGTGTNMDPEAPIDNGMGICARARDPAFSELTIGSASADTARICPSKDYILAWRHFLGQVIRCPLTLELDLAIRRFASEASATTSTLPAVALMNNNTSSSRAASQPPTVRH